MYLLDYESIYILWVVSVLCCRKERKNVKQQQCAKYLMAFNISN